MLPVFAFINGRRLFRYCSMLSELAVSQHCLQTMQALPTVIVRPGEADRIVAGHPWVYQGSIMRVTSPPSDGEIVQVKDHRQRMLGIGFFNSKSKIHVR